jgi:23S rRNA pseudouridine1911/1915/1917 synthase
MSRQFHFCISAEDARQRLDVFLAARFGGLSRIRLANLIRSSACLVNQQPQGAGYHLTAGDVVEITLDDGAPTAMNPEAIALEILHEDEQLIVVVKPAGMLVHPTRNVKSGTLLNALAYHLNQPKHTEAASPEASDYLYEAVRPGLVHRLDRATSGVMVIGKTQRALSLLTRHFHNRLVKKLYLAVVEGEVAKSSGAIIAPLGLDENRRPPRWVMAGGKYAESRFRVLERRTGATLLELEPVTGRTNQLRIHCAFLGHPIVGDDIYGAVVGGQWPVVSEEPAATNDGETILSSPPIGVKVTDPRPPTPDPRLCLHAARLEFHHPGDGTWMVFDSPLPEDCQSIWQAFA